MSKDNLAENLNPINFLPGIKKAALAIAYDNGMINRTTSEEEFLYQASKCLWEIPVKFLVKIDMIMQELSEEELETLCNGEENESRKVVVKFGLLDRTTWKLLNDIFGEEILFS